MANPQKEEGYVPIANKLAEAFARLELWPAESKILWTVLRKTYGWGKKEDAISLSQFEQMTRLSRSQVCKTITSLVSRKILVSRKTLPNKACKPCKYSLQKDFEKWVVSRETLVSSETMASVSQDNRVVSPETHTKDTITKDTITKDNNKAVAKKSSLTKRTKLPTIPPILQPMLNIMWSIKNWPKDESKDVTVLSQVISDFPEVDPIPALKSFAVWHLDKPLSRKSNARLRLRNWFQTSLRLGQNLKVVVPTKEPDFNREARQKIIEQFEREQKERDLCTSSSE